MRTTTLARILAAAALLAATMLARAEWPEKPIHVIVPFTAGSATDVIARTVLEAVAAALEQPIVVENKAGAGGTIGAAQVARSSPDGYTLLAHSAGHVSNPVIYTHLGYDTLKDFRGITPLASLPNVLVVSPKAGFETVHDLVARAKAQPGALNYASAGIGSATHMNAEIFQHSAQFEAQHVPFRGTPEAMTEVFAGRIDFFFAPLTAALPLINDGRLQPLAIGTPRRSPLLPRVPTTLEAGYEGSEFTFWVALIAPAATPQPIVDRLNAEVLKALASSDVRQKLARIGAEPMPMRPADFDAFLKAEVARMGRVVRAARITVE